ncbi:MAG: hypothetical protein CMJ18_26060 [Phycisphaeraceae bacterium]|nr:hypothetical protein [Phycisphaeraceae bacterium]
MHRAPLAIALVTVIVADSALGRDAGRPVVLAARDSLDPARDATADGRAMLEDLAWEPVAFEVRLAAPAWPRRVTFPSPVPSGDRVNDRVTLEWFVARDASGAPVPGPAVLLLHALDGQMVATRAMAGYFAHNGIHAFAMHLPGYNSRRTAKSRPGLDSAVVLLRQAIVDARRAADAIAACPHVDGEHVGLVGTSLGGFIASVTAAIDNRFAPVFILLAGGDLENLLKQRMRDLPGLRRRMRQRGLTGSRLSRIVARVEPVRLAHRLDRRRTWLYSATRDRVVPPASARALASAARLDAEHHVWLEGNHVSVAVNLPWIVLRMTEEVRRTAASGGPPTGPEL